MAFDEESTYAQWSSSSEGTDDKEDDKYLHLACGSGKGQLDSSNERKKL